MIGKAQAPARFSWSLAMPIRKLATPSAYSPEQITVLISAHKAACAHLAWNQLIWCMLKQLHVRFWSTPPRLNLTMIAFAIARFMIFELK